MKNKIRYAIQQRSPVVYSKIVKIANGIRKIKSRQRKKSFGNLNPNSTIYIIRIRRETLGLMGYYMAILGHIRIAEGLGAIPVVDMMNFKNPYLSDNEVGKKNSWEFYFNQLTKKISLEEAYKSKNVILSNLETPFEANPRWFYERVYRKNMTEKYYSYVSKYIHFNDLTKERLLASYTEIFSHVKDKGDKIIGVVSRSTDIIGFPGHSIQPTIDELLQEVLIIMKQYGCKYVFMASDSDSAVRYFEEQIGKEIILTNSCQRYDSFNTSKAHVLSEVHFDRENDEYKKGEEYLTTMYLLSRCDVLFGSLVGSTIGAICMNQGEYDHVEIFDKGVYT